MIQGSRTSWCWSVGSMDGRLQGGLSVAVPMLLAKERALELDGSNSTQGEAYIHFIFYTLPYKEILSRRQLIGQAMPFC
jgi:hypothetical protein